jgi:chromosome segregation ATPase
LLESATTQQHEETSDDPVENPSSSEEEELQQALQLLRSKDTDIEELKLNLEKKENEVFQLQQRLLSKPTTNSDTPPPVAAAAAPAVDLSAVLADKEKQIKKLTDTIESLKISMAVHGNRKEKKNDDDDNDSESKLFSLLSDKDALIEVLEGRLHDKETEIANLLQSSAVAHPSATVDEKDLMIANLEESNRDLQKHLQLLRKERRSSKPETTTAMAPTPTAMPTVTAAATSDQSESLLLKQSPDDDDPLSKLLEDLQTTQSDLDLTKIELKKKNDELEPLLVELENVKEEKDTLSSQASFLLEKCEHLQIVSEDAEAREKAAISQIDSLRHEVNQKLFENEKLKKRIAELEASGSWCLDDPPSLLLISSQGTHSRAQL